MEDALVADGGTLFAEIEVDGLTAYVGYALKPGVISFVHTEVPEGLAGKGIASRLARHVLDSARALLADVLRGAIAQQLLPRLGGGRIPATELLFGTGAMSQLIRDGKTR